MRQYFTRLLGNDTARRRIGRNIEDGTLPHALLIGGPHGSGKTVLALEIAAALCCEKKSTDASLPCGGCSACRRIYEGGFPDVKVTGKPSDRATLGVDTVKSLREDMFLSSTEAEYKIYIIKDAECMTVEAQNALLKVLEEPPAGVIIMLLARESDKILTTIKSRTQYIAMSRFTESELERILPSVSDEARRLKSDDAEKFRSVIMSADGTIGEAIRLSSKKSAEECRAKRDETVRVLMALRGGSTTDIYLAVMALQSAKRPEVLASLEDLIAALRDLICVSMADDTRLLFFTSRSEAHTLAVDIGISRIMNTYDAVIAAHGYCSRNANIANLLTNLSAGIAPIDKKQLL